MLAWGVLGLIEGKGFFGGIGVQFDAIGDLFVMALKGVAIIGIGWFILDRLKYRDENSKK